jgi:serine/threonine protein kinase
MTYRHPTGSRPLPGYIIKRALGSGGFGQVYLAASDCGKLVAAKHVIAHDRLEAETRGARFCINLKHPALTEVLDLKTMDDGSIWIIAEYIEGPTLRQYLTAPKTPEQTRKALEVFLQLSEAVIYLHQRGFVHRDLKPENVFLENGNVKLGDFGLVRFTNAKSSLTGTTPAGTPLYAPPEGFNHPEIHHHLADQYALGVILFELLTGKYPFDNVNKESMHQAKNGMMANFDGVDINLTGILKRSLSPVPSNRYPTLWDMAQAVREVLASTAPPVYIPPTTTKISGTEIVDIKIPLTTEDAIDYLAKAPARTAAITFLVSMAPWLFQPLRPTWQTRDLLTMVVILYVGTIALKGLVAFQWILPKKPVTNQVWYLVVGLLLATLDCFLAGATLEDLRLIAIGSTGSGTPWLNHLSTRYFFVVLATSVAPISYWLIGDPLLSNKYWWLHPAIAIGLTMCYGFLLGLPLQPTILIMPLLLLITLLCQRAGAEDRA